MGLRNDDELMVESGGFVQGDRQERSCPRRGCSFACCLGGPDSLEGGGCCLCPDIGGQLLRLLSQTLLFSEVSSFI